MTFFIPSHRKLATLLAAAAVAIQVFGCTVKKDRAPGPLVVWLISDPASEEFFRLYADDFSQNTGIPLELVFKDPAEVRSLLINYPEDVLGEVDLIETDLFDVYDFAPHMQGLEDLLRTVPRISNYYESALSACEYQGQRRFLPWRLSWPGRWVG